MSDADKIAMDVYRDITRREMEGTDIRREIAAAIREAQREAYRAGFITSAEGYNGEYPFEGIDPETDARWVAQRDRILSEARP